MAKKVITNDFSFLDEPQDTGSVVTDDFSFLEDESSKKKEEEISTISGKDLEKEQGVGTTEQFQQEGKPVQSDFVATDPSQMLQQELGETQQQPASTFVAKPMVEMSAETKEDVQQAAEEAEEHVDLDSLGYSWATGGKEEVSQVEAPVSSVTKTESDKVAEHKVDEGMVGELAAARQKDLVEERRKYEDSEISSYLGEIVKTTKDSLDPLADNDEGFKALYNAAVAGAKEKNTGDFTDEYVETKAQEALDEVRWSAIESISKDVTTQIEEGIEGGEIEKEEAAISSPSIAGGGAVSDVFRSSMTEEPKETLFVSATEDDIDALYVHKHATEELKDKRYDNLSSSDKQAVAEHTANSWRYNKKVLPLAVENTNKSLKEKGIPTIDEKTNQLQDQINSGEITKEGADTELKNHYDVVDKIATEEIKKAEESVPIPTDIGGSLEYFIKTSINDNTLGLAKQLISGEKFFNVYGYKPTEREEFLAAVGSFIIDPLLLVGGPVAGGISKAGAKLMLTRSIAKVEQKLIANGVEKSLAKKMALDATNARLSSLTRIGSSAGVLGIYDSANNALQQGMEANDIDDINWSESLKEGGIGLAVGASTGGIGVLGSRAEQSVTKWASGNFSRSLINKGVVAPIEFGAENVAFVGVGGALRGTPITEEELKHSFEFLGALKSVGFLKKLSNNYVRSGKFTNSNVNSGEYKVEFDGTELKSLDAGKTTENALRTLKDGDKFLEVMNDKNVSESTKNKILWSKFGYKPKGGTTFPSKVSVEGNVVTTRGEDGSLLQSKEYSSEAEARKESLKVQRAIRDEKKAKEIEGMSPEELLEMDEKFDEKTKGRLIEALAVSPERRDSEQKKLIRDVYKDVDSILSKRPKPEAPTTTTQQTSEVKPKEEVVEEKQPKLTKFTEAKEERWGEVLEPDGTRRDLTREEFEAYEAEIAKPKEGKELKEIEPEEKPVKGVFDVKEDIEASLEKLDSFNEEIYALEKKLESLEKGMNRLFKSSKSKERDLHRIRELKEKIESNRSQTNNERSWKYFLNKPKPEPTGEVSRGEYFLGIEGGLESGKGVTGGRHKFEESSRQGREEGTELIFEETTGENGEKIFSVTNPDVKDNVGRKSYYTIKMVFPKGSPRTLADVKDLLTKKNQSFIVNHTEHGVVDVKNYAAAVLELGLVAPKAETGVKPKEEVAEPTAEVKEEVRVDEKSFSGSLSDKVKALDAGMGEKAYNYTTERGVEVTLRSDDSVVEVGGEEVSGDVKIDFIGVEEGRGEGRASEEVDRILAEADKRDMSVSIEADPERASTTFQGEKIGEKGLTTQELIDWYSRKGFVFEGNYGYRPRKSEDASKYKEKTYSAKPGEVKPDDIQEVSDKQTLRSLERAGELKEGFYETEDNLYRYDEGNLLKVDNIDVSYDFGLGEYVVKEKAVEVAAEVKGVVVEHSPFVSKESGVYEYDGMFSIEKTQGSGLTDPLVDDVQGGSGYFFFQKGIDAKVVMMSPHEYLRKVRQGFKTQKDEGIRGESEKRINEAVDRGDKIDMPYLDYRGGKFSQEGRNRAAVAEKRGEKKIPVLIVNDVTESKKNFKIDEIIKKAVDAVGEDKAAIGKHIRNVQKLHSDAVWQVEESTQFKDIGTDTDVEKLRKLNAKLYEVRTNIEFDEISSEIERLQEAQKKKSAKEEVAEPTTEVKEEVTEKTPEVKRVAEEAVEKPKEAQKKPSKERVDNIVNDIVDKVKARQFGDDTNPKVIAEAAQGYMQGSKYYTEATDIEREAAVREINKNLGIKEVKAPSVKKVLGEPKPKKVEVTEMAALKDQIKFEVKAAKKGAEHAKKAAKNIKKAISDLIKSEPKELGLNEFSKREIGSLITQLGKVPTTSKQAEIILENIYDTFARAGIRKEIKTAKKHSKTIKKQKAAFGEHSDVALELASVDPTLIPREVLPEFLSVMEGLAQRGTKEFKDIDNAYKIRDKINEGIADNSETIQEYAEKFEELKDSPEVKDRKGNIDSDKMKAAIVDAFGLEGFDVEFMSNNYSSIKKLASKGVEARDKADVEAESKELIEVISKGIRSRRAVKPFLATGGAPYRKKLFNYDQQGIINTLMSIKPEDLSGMSLSELKSLEKTLRNIDKGWLNPQSQSLASKVSGQQKFRKMEKDVESVNSVMDEFGGKIKPGTDGFVKALKKSSEEKYKDASEIIESFVNKHAHNLDTVIGKVKNSAFYKEVVHPITGSLNIAQEEFNRVRDKVDGYFNKIKGNSFENNVMLELYAREREFLSNPENNKVVSSREHVEATEFDKDGKFIRNIFDKFSNKEGELDVDKIETELHKRGAKDYLNYKEFVLKEIKPMAEFLSLYFRGTGFESYKNYSPRSSSKPIEITKIEDNLSIKRTSTSSGNTKDRAAGQKSIRFDDVGNLLRATQSIMLDYHVTPELNNVRSALRVMSKEGDARTVELSKAITEYLQRTLNTEYNRDVSENKAASMAVKKIVKNAYESTLSGVRKMAVETVANITKASIMYPKQYASGLKDVELFSKKGIKKKTEALMGFAKSTHKGRIGSHSAQIKDIASSLQSKGRTTTKYSAGEKIVDFVYNNKAEKRVGQVNRALITAADSPVIGPMWRGHFKEQFKKETGRDFDWNLSEDKQYLADNKKAIQDVGAVADQKLSRIINTGASSEAVLKDKEYEGTIKKNVLAFVKGFATNERDNFVNSAKTLIGAKTSTNRKEAARIMTSLVVNQAMYATGRQLITSAILAGLGWGDEERVSEALKKDVKDESLWGRVGADMFVTNLFGNRNNLIKLALSAGINWTWHQLMDENKDKAKDITYSPGINDYHSLQRGSGAVGKVIESTQRIVGESEKLLDAYIKGDKKFDEQFKKTDWNSLALDGMLLTTGVPGGQDASLIAREWNKNKNKKKDTKKIMWTD